MDDLFQESWRIYQALVNHDYMEHKSIVLHIVEHLKQLSKPLSILELGCGDGIHASRIILQLPVNHYIGVDVTECALDMLMGNFSELKGVSVELRHQDMRRYLEQSRQPVDVILAGYCVHHLSHKEKQEFIRNALNSLKPGGELLIYDVFLESGQTRDAYLQAYLKSMRQDWCALGLEDLDKIEAHIIASDYPEEVETFRQWGDQTGYSGVAQIWQGQFLTNRMLSLVAPAL